MFAVGGGTSGKESACQYKRHIGVLQFMGHKELDTLESVCARACSQAHTHTCTLAVCQMADCLSSEELCSVLLIEA